MLAAERQPIAERSFAAAAVANATVVVAFATAIFIAGQIRIPLPFTPIPITLQTFAVYLGAAWLGAGRGVGGPLLFAAAAASGLPVRSGFASGLTGASAGYILGWMLAAFLIGRMLGGKDASIGRTVAVMAGGSALVYTCGLLHLTLLLDLPLSQALWMGFLPFLPGDALKIAAATAAYRSRPNLLSSL
jgi:biotin transport system substrate-specific component